MANGYTKYGETIRPAHMEKSLQEFHATSGATTGAAGHCRAMGTDTGDNFRVTGMCGQISSTYKSLFAAESAMRAQWGAESLWHILPDNKRKLVFRR